MRAALESRLNQIWYGQASPPWYLRILIPLYRLLFALDRRRKLRGQDQDLRDKCIIVVGNISVGGSGKTPLLIRLCALLRSAGLSPGVVSRGYGRGDKQQRQVGPEDDAEQVGDEPLLIARRAGIPVVVGANRSEGARWLFQQGVDLVLSDDGLQHAGLPRSIEVCVIDGERGFGNGCLLPAGPLRESISRLNTVDHVIINGGDADSLPGDRWPEGTPWIRMDIQATRVQSVNEDLSWRLAQFSGCRVSALAGIGNPDRFFKTLRLAGIEVSENVFPDHHRFSREDFEKLPDDIPVIMTEKDAVKCAGLGLKNAWYVRADALLPTEWERQFLKEVRQFIHES